jgi:dihydrofolate reductase
MSVTPKKEGAGESPLISLIVAASTNNMIGNKGQLLWHLPQDMKFFKNTTWGLPVIMGRKTFDALSNRPLPGRFNIIVSRHAKGLSDIAGVHLVKSLGEAIILAAGTDCLEVFIIGGGQLFELAMPRAGRIYLTRVHAVLEGDALFPPIPEAEWEKEDSIDFPQDAKHAYPYSFERWSRK